MVDFSEFSKSNDAGNAIVPPGIKETNVQWQVGLVLFVVTGKHVKSVSIKIGIQVTVPAPGSIRVRIMSGTGTVVYAIIGTFAYSVPTWISMGMDTGTISGSSEIVRINKPQFHGRRNGGNGEELLQCFFIIKGKRNRNQKIADDATT